MKILTYRRFVYAIVVTIRRHHEVFVSSRHCIGGREYCCMAVRDGVKELVSFLRYYFP
jgi:hypothetical protein